jgi:hypothetical protein
MKTRDRPSVLGERRVPPAPASEAERAEVNVRYLARSDALSDCAVKREEHAGDETQQTKRVPMSRYKWMSCEGARNEVEVLGIDRRVEGDVRYVHRPTEGPGGGRPCKGKPAVRPGRKATDLHEQTAEPPRRGGGCGGSRTSEASHAFEEPFRFSRCERLRAESSRC